MARKGHVLKSGVQFVKHQNRERRLWSLRQLRGRLDANTVRDHMLRGSLEGANLLRLVVLNDGKILLLEIRDDLAGLIRHDHIQNNQTRCHDYGGNFASCELILRTSRLGDRGGRHQHQHEQ